MSEKAADVKRKTFRTVVHDHFKKNETFWLLGNKNKEMRGGSKLLHITVVSE